MSTNETCDRCGRERNEGITEVRQKQLQRQEAVMENL